VSSSRLQVVRGEKLSAYAAAGIPVYWIVNLNSRCVEVYTEPRAADAPGYARHEDRGASEQVEVVIAGQVVGRIAVAELLPAG
jgi:Uma2 family endonuclease